MKKVIALVIILVLVAMVFVACNNGVSSKDEKLIVKDLKNTFGNNFLGYTIEPYTMNNTTSGNAYLVSILQTSFYRSMRHYLYFIKEDGTLAKSEVSYQYL